ncbi:MAG: DUF484 family protein [Methylacidiphilales bacterium]|nr:DUF484 family protein [Candidatus Methylacidiphilales bacterium]
MNDNTKSVLTDSELTEEVVASYLTSHKDFLDKHPDIFKAINIPHMESTGLSLLERQIELWKKEAKASQNFLEDIINNVRANQVLVEGIIRFSAELQKATSFEQLVSLIQFQIKSYFPIHHVSILFISFDGFHQSLELLPESMHQLFTPLLLSGKPRLGNYNAHQVTLLFPQDARAINSMAMIPINSLKAKAVIALGSPDQDSFSEDKGIEFLEYLQLTISSAFDRYLGSNIE